MLIMMSWKRYKSIPVICLISTLTCGKSKGARLHSNIVVLMYSKNWIYISGFWLVNTTCFTVDRYMSMNMDFTNCSLVKFSFVLLRFAES